MSAKEIAEKWRRALKQKFEFMHVVNDQEIHEVIKDVIPERVQMNHNDCGHRTVDVVAGRAHPSSRFPRFSGAREPSETGG